MNGPSGPGPGPGPGPSLPSGPPGAATGHALGDGTSLAAGPPPTDHRVLKSLLGAWALAACSAQETAAVEAHLTDCAPCADEALRLRDAVALLHPEDNLDLDPQLRSRVLAGCLGRRPARIPVPEWAAPYDAETARLDTLLHDMGESEWRAPVPLKWFDGQRERSRVATVAGALGQLTAVDGLIAAVLGLDDPLEDSLAHDAGPTDGHASPADRVEVYWKHGPVPSPGAVRDAWRGQTHALVRAVSLRDTHGLTVPYGGLTLPLSDSFLERAFACWVRAGDIAEAVDYPYRPPLSPHLHRMIDLTARLLPGVLARRRRDGLAGPPRSLVTAGSPGRTLHLEVEGSGGGHWYIALDSPAAAPSAEKAVAHVALDGTEFCRLAAGHVPPEEAAAGQEGDREAIHDVLAAAASLSWL
ncbi:anti-sigma factor family protein [Streptomyces xinghaiensis]|uniref:anti-sigma factor family protein n=1 Tax=Streptomyces xinghaiensis TaxID=1038928 RepID=UPI002E0EFFBB|nr:zf-HC2 domain-containing protein [Streptomyces xinghaiensis]